MYTIPLPVFLERSSDCFFVLDPANRIVFCNGQAVEELSGVELVGAALVAAFPGGADTIAARHGRAVAEQTAQSFELFEPARECWYHVQLVPCGHLTVMSFRNVTERRRAVEAADAHRQMLDAILRDAFVGIARFDENGELLFANDRFCEMVGRSSALLKEHGLFPCLDTEDTAKLVLELQHPTGRPPLSMEARFVLPDGQSRWCALRLSFPDHGTLGNAITLVAHDIGEAREARQRATETTTLLETIIDSAEDLIFVKDISGRFVLTNRTMNQLGPSLLGRTVEELYPAELARIYAEEDHKVMATRAASAVDEIIPVAGEARIFQTLKVPWSVDGEIRGVIGISRDLTDRLEAEARIREREERYRLAARATNDAIWDWDLVTGELGWNESIEQLAGAPPGPTGDWWKERIHGDDVDAVLGGVGKFIEEGGEHWQAEYRFRRSDGTYATVFDRGFLVRDSAGRPVRMIGAMTDITSRVEAQRQLDEVRNELIHVSRVSAMGTMASALAHELNQPLTAVASYVSGARRMLREQGPEALALVTPILDDTAQEVIRAGEMIRRLRRMVAHRNACTQPISVPQLVEDALALALPNPGLKKVEVLQRTARNLIVEADGIQIQQVLVNLIRNAVEAMEGGDRRVLRISARRRADLVRIRVGDTGCGMSHEIRERLFTAFGTTKRDGLGVGLTICRTIVEAHGGHILVESSDGTGTVMAFDLPAATARGEKPGVGVH